MASSSPLPEYVKAIQREITALQREIKKNNLQEQFKIESRTKGLIPSPLSSYKKVKGWCLSGMKNKNIGLGVDYFPEDEEHYPFWIYNGLGRIHFSGIHVSLYYSKTFNEWNIVLDCLSVDGERIASLYIN